MCHPEQQTVGRLWGGFVATQDDFLKQELWSQSNKISVLNLKFSFICFKEAKYLINFLLTVCWILKE